VDVAGGPSKGVVQHALKVGRTTHLDRSGPLSRRCVVEHALGAGRTTHPVGFGSPVSAWDRSSIGFARFAQTHYELVVRRLNEPHVAEWWDD